MFKIIGPLRREVKGVMLPKPKKVELEFVKDSKHTCQHCHTTAMLVLRGKNVVCSLCGR